MGHILSTVTLAPDKYIFVSGDLLPSMWYSLLRKSVSLDACAAILHYYTCINSPDFPCETDNTRRNRQNIYFDESERR